MDVAAVADELYALAPTDFIPARAEAVAAGKLLGRPVEWRGKTSPKGGFLFAAGPLEDAKSKTAEVLVKATRQQKALDEMRGVLLPAMMALGNT